MSSSIGMMRFPILMGTCQIHGNQTTNQPSSSSSSSSSSSGWWLGHPSEKYEFVNWDDDSQYFWENNPNGNQTTNQLYIVRFHCYHMFFLQDLQTFARKSPITRITSTILADEIPEKTKSYPCLNPYSYRKCS